MQSSSDASALACSLGRPAAPRPLFPPLAKSASCTASSESDASQRGPEPSRSPSVEDSPAERWTRELARFAERVARLGPTESLLPTQFALSKLLAGARSQGVVSESMRTLLTSLYLFFEVVSLSPPPLQQQQPTPESSIPTLPQLSRENEALRQQLQVLASEESRLQAVRQLQSDNAALRAERDTLFQESIEHLQQVVLRVERPSQASTLLQRALEIVRGTEESEKEEDADGEARAWIDRFREALDERDAARSDEVASLAQQVSLLEGRLADPGRASSDAVLPYLPAQANGLREDLIGLSKANAHQSGVIRELKAQILRMHDSLSLSLSSSLMLSSVERGHSLVSPRGRSQSSSSPPSHLDSTSAVMEESITPHQPSPASVDFQQSFEMLSDETRRPSEPRGATVSSSEEDLRTHVHALEQHLRDIRASFRLFEDTELPVHKETLRSLVNTELCVPAASRRLGFLGEAPFSATASVISLCDQQRSLDPSLSLSLDYAPTNRSSGSPLSIPSEITCIDDYLQSSKTDGSLTESPSTRAQQLERELEEERAALDCLSGRTQSLAVQLEEREREAALLKQEAQRALGASSAAQDSLESQLRQSEAEVGRLGAQVAEQAERLRAFEQDLARAKAQMAEQSGLLGAREAALLAAEGALQGGRERSEALREELERSERESERLRAELEDGGAQIARMQTDATEREHALREAQAAASGREVDLRAERARVDDLQERTRVLERQALEREQSLASLGAERAALREKEADQSATVAALEAEKQRLTSEVSRLSESIVSLREDAQSLERSRVQQAEATRRAEALLEEARARRGSVEQELQSLTERYSEERRQWEASLASSLSRRESEIGALESERSTLRSSLESAERERDALRSEAESLRQRSDRTEEELRRMRESARSEARASSEIQALRERVASLESQNESQGAELRRFEGLAATLGQAVELMEGRTRGFVESIESLVVEQGLGEDAGLEEVRELLMARHAQLRQREELIQSLQDAQLREEQAHSLERLALEEALVLTSAAVRCLSQQMAALDQSHSLKLSAVEQTHSGALAELKHVQSLELAELDARREEATERARRELAELAQRLQQSEVARELSEFTHRTDTAALSEAVLLERGREQDASARLSVLDGELRRLREEQAVLQEQLELREAEQSDSMERSEAAVSVLQERLLALETARSETAQRAEALEAEKSEVVEQLAFLGSEKATLLQRLGLLEPESRQLSERLTINEAALSTISETLTAVEREHSEVSERLSAVECERSELSERLTHAESAQMDVTQRLTVVVRERSELLERLTVSESALSATQERLAVVERERTELSERVSTVERERTELSERLRIAERDQATTTERLSVVEGERSRLEARVESLESEAEVTREQLQQAFLGLLSGSEGDSDSSRVASGADASTESGVSGTKRPGFFVTDLLEPLSQSFHRLEAERGDSAAQLDRTREELEASQRRLREHRLSTHAKLERARSVLTRLQSDTRELRARAREQETEHARQLLEGEQERARLSERAAGLERQVGEAARRESELREAQLSQASELSCLRTLLLTRDSERSAAQQSLERDLRDLRDKLAQSLAAGEREVTDLRQALQRSEQERDEARTTLGTANTALPTLQERLLRAKASSERRGKEACALKLEVAKRDQLIALLKDKIAEFQRCLEEIRGQFEQKKRELEENSARWRTKLAGYKSALEERTTALASLKRENEAIREQSRSLVADVEAPRSSEAPALLEERAATIDRLGAELSSLRSRLGDSESGLAGERAAADSARREASDLRRRLSAAEEEAAALRRRAEESEARGREAPSAVGESVAAREAAERRVADLELEVESLRTRLREREERVRSLKARKQTYRGDIAQLREQGNLMSSIILSLEKSMESSGQSVTISRDQFGSFVQRAKRTERNLSQLLEAYDELTLEREALQQRLGEACDRERTMGARYRSLSSQTRSLFERMDAARRCVRRLKERADGSVDFSPLESSLASEHGSPCSITAEFDDFSDDPSSVCL